MIRFDLQPTHLLNNSVTLIPLKSTDFDRLFDIASNPLVWEQHPNKNRYQLKDFTTYFEGALASKGAFIVLDSKTDKVVGSSRFYDLDLDNLTIKIGYTFIGIDYWGRGYNKNMKKLMLEYVFEKLNIVTFEVGANNMRSQKAIEAIGAIKINEKEIEYYGEDSKLNYIYAISKPGILRKFL